MNTEEKIAAIIERTKSIGIDVDQAYLSPMTAVYYLDKIAEYGFLEVPFEVTDTGRKVGNICDEFEWSPTDEELADFAVELFPVGQREVALMFLVKFRDDRDSLIEQLASNFKSEKSEKSEESEIDDSKE